MAKPRVVVAWSSGKDSAWALWRLQSQKQVEVVGLLTTLSEETNAVAMHALPRDLLNLQAKATRLPLHEVSLPMPCPNSVYEARMGKAVEALRAEGVTQIAFGDLFLEDIRRYREEKMAGSGIEPIFPLWGENTRRLAEEMIDGGLTARILCVDSAQAPAQLVGRSFDRTFLAELPEGFDPCGERGEFHSFVTAGPMLHEGLSVCASAPVTDAHGFARVKLQAA